MDKSFFKIYTNYKAPVTAHNSEHNIGANDLSVCSTADARKLIPFELAQRHKILPLGIIQLLDRKILAVAAVQGDEVETSKIIRFTTELEPKILPVSEEVLNAAIFKAYKSDESTLVASAQALNHLVNRASRQAEIQISPSGNSTEITRFLSTLLEYAIAKTASDLHIVPMRSGSWVRMRVSGKLFEHEGALCSLELHNQIIRRVKVLAGLDTTKTKLPQDGSFVIPVGGNHVFLRVSIMPTLHGEKVVLRLLSNNSVRSPGELGFDSTTLASIERYLKCDHGILLVCGPTGSGKTTSLYSLALKLKSQQLNLVSIEDPIEVQLEGISQTALQPHLGLDFSTCLRAVVRQDPDVILLGEIRDPESAKVAIQAALTGHRLLSSVHARSVREVLTRLESLGVERSLMNQAIALIINQRLLPRLCNTCKVVDLNASSELGSIAHRAVGCQSCDYSGYVGRVLACESLLLSMSGEQSSWQTDEALLGSPNYVPLRENLEKLVRNGSISLEQCRAALCTFLA